MPADDDAGRVRLQKVMSAAGIASRRVSEDLIAAGRVQVNGQVVTELGSRIDPAHDHLTVDGSAVQIDPTRRTVMLNKPTGIVSSLKDEQGRPDLTRFTAKYEERLFNVGRLDADTSGLLLLTNDGELAHRLAHPSYGVSKTYLAEVTGPVARDVGKRLRAGIELDDGVVKADSFRLVDTVGNRVMVEVVLHEGRKHVVRRMLAEIGHPVSRLVRTDYGPISLGNLKPGKQRKLSQQEIGALFHAVGL
jgi:23S rRNA pseudouridine2605 synthase